MAGQVLKKRRLVNAGRRRMTPAQIKFFGTKRQKAALRNRRHRNTGRRHNRRRNQAGGIVSQAEHAAASAIRTVERAAEDAIDSVTGMVNRGRRRNVGEILTVIPANPGRRRRKNRMAATRRRNRRRASNRGVRRANRRANRSRAANRRRNFSRRHRNRNPKVIVRYRNRPRRHNRGHRRRNPDFLRGDAGAVIGVLGGAAVTSMITGFLPANFTTGWMGYLATGAVAAVQGQVVGKVFKNSKLGNWMTVGGMVIVALKIASDMGFHIPGLTSGTSGMGLLTSSNFYVPQANIPGSMATFVTPAGVTAAIPIAAPTTSAALHGLGQQFAPGLRTMRRVGRLR